MNEVLTPILARLMSGESLAGEDVAAALGEILEGRATDVQAAGFIVALRAKGETAEELAALVETMRRFGTSVAAPEGAIDTCGTGGDRAGTVNVSTMAALMPSFCGTLAISRWSARPMPGMCAPARSLGGACSS